MRFRIITAVVILLLLVFFSFLLTPKYMSGVYEGAMIAEYYDSEKNHQIAIIGDCEVYENISPVTLWREYGYTSYIRGSAQQLAWQSYYLLEDMLRYETPEVVIFSVLALKYDEPQSEAYNRISIDGMKLSGSKLNAAFASMTPGENILSYLFPLLRFHDRWKELNPDDFKYLFTREKVTHNGFMMRMDVKPVDVIPEGPPLRDYKLGSNAMGYLDKMRLLCEEKGIDFVLLKAPSIYPYWYDQWDEQIVVYANEYNLKYLNTLAAADEIGIDFSTDTYDAGLHLNCPGAEKLSVYLGSFLREEYGLADLRNDSELTEVWRVKCEAYDRMKEAQLKDLENTGKIQTFYVG